MTKWVKKFFSVKDVFIPRCVAICQDLVQHSEKFKKNIQIQFHLYKLKYVVLYIEKNNQHKEDIMDSHRKEIRMSEIREKNTVYNELITY